MGRIVLYGFHLFLLGAFFYFIALLLWFFSLFNVIIFPDRMALLFELAKYLFLIALISFIVDLVIPAFFFPRKRELRFEPIKDLKISVGMTAYNDEEAIGPSVKEFKNSENVVSVVVIDNNCVDDTAKKAKEAGATVVREIVQGYGAACKRALQEARKKGNLVCLVEGDQTFSSADLKKLVSYIENCDMVVGTRTTAEIVAPDSQVTTFMRYGNLFMAKLIQLRYWDKLRLTDVGCTFRIIRPEALDKIIDQLYVVGNHFSPHMILVALKNNLKIIEVPITLRKRVGESKGVGSNVFKGLLNGLQMWKMILLH